jgi:pantoate--beta-alanine ligase
MKIFKHKSELIDYLDTLRSKGKKIGLVPTMGALHEGHLDLIRASRSETDVTLCSIFVNPKQFNNKEDLIKYPKTLDEDFNILQQENCDIIYAPPDEDLYPHSENIITAFQFGEMESILEGKYRPGHFRGVALVVVKLFNIVQPHFAYFGQKDLQQYFLVENIVRDLSFRIQLRCIPTVRESDGLAMSSRNLRISTKDRPKANLFYKSLLQAKEMLYKGISISDIKDHIHQVFSLDDQLTLEYFEIIDTTNFTITNQIKDPDKTALCIAGYLNNIRLIDNVMYI